MNTIGMSIDACKILIFLFLLADVSFGRPHKNTIKNDGKIVKRVDISYGPFSKSQVAIRRQSVIHAGEDYASDSDKNKPEVDELENLGKIVDYDGKIIETHKPAGSKWKDTNAISKDVIEKIKEIQDSLMKRSGGKELAAKLEQMQPLKNITVSSSDNSEVTSRKIIPEDVVNKIILKFQELRTQAKELARFDEQKSVDGSEKEGTGKKGKENKKEDKKEEKAKHEHETKQIDEKVKDKDKPKEGSAYATIGPAKENEEVRNVTQNSVNELQSKMPGNQEIYKATTSGLVSPEQSQNSFPQNQMKEQNDMMQQKNSMFPQNIPMQNMQRNMMMTQGKVPMMFIRSGQMLVPVFGGQNGPVYGAPSGKFPSRRDAYGRQEMPFMPTQAMAPSLVPQQPMIVTGQSRSVPPSLNAQQNGFLNIPSVPYSVIMSLMAGPNTIPNQNMPAAPFAQPQMGGGVYNMPQNQAPSFMGPGAPRMMMNGPPPNGDITGSSRGIENERPYPGRESMEEYPGHDQAQREETSTFMGGYPGQSQQSMADPRQGMGMTNPPPAVPQAVSMDMNGKLSLLSTMNSPPMSQQAFGSQNRNPFEETQQAFGPPNQNPFEETQQAFRPPNQNPFEETQQAFRPPNINPLEETQQAFRPPNRNPLEETIPAARNGIEMFDKRKQMMNPETFNPVNDLSDPTEKPSQSNLRNVNPDSLLELAKFRSTESDNPDIGDPRGFSRNPDTLLDTIHTKLLDGRLSGAGDPDQMAMGGQQGRPSHSPFDNSNPETLLDMLSKRKSNDIANKNVRDWEEGQQRQVWNVLNSEKAFGRGQISAIGTSGMQSVSSIPSQGIGSLDPSFADVVGRRAPFEIGSRNSAGDIPVESSFFRPKSNMYGPNSISVMSQDSLRYQHSKDAIDSGDSVRNFHQADVFVRHKIANPEKFGQKYLKTRTLHDDKIDFQVNGKTVAEKGSLRSKIVDGKIQKGHGQILTSKSPVRIELSHANDAKKTKIVNIITTGKFHVKESRRNKISQKEKKQVLRKFYKKS